MKKLKTEGSFKKGHIVTKETRKKQSDSHIGKYPSEETKQKISLALKGKKHSLEHNKKVSLALMGKSYPNKRGMLNKNHSEKTKNKISKSNKGKHYSPGTEFKKGGVSPRKGIKISKEQIEKMRIKSKKIWNKPEYKKFARERRAKQIIPFKDTSIELRIQGFLTLLKIEYIAHKYISKIEHKYCCDIFIPSMNLIIECDGDYFHGNNEYLKKRGLTINQRQIEQRQRDEIRTKELEEKGFRVIRLWEHEIRIMELNELNERIK